MYNLLLLLKHSGISPAVELQSFSIQIVVDLPGMGTNLQDHYKISVQVCVPINFTLLDGCMFSNPDPCLTKWENPVLSYRGTYLSDRFAATMLYKSTASDNSNWDTFLFGGPINFRGYFPGYSINITEWHDIFSWAILKAHPTIMLAASPCAPLTYSMSQTLSSTTLTPAPVTIWPTCRQCTRPLSWRAIPLPASLSRQPRSCRVRALPRRPTSSCTSRMMPGAITDRAPAPSAPMATRWPCSTPASASAA